MKNLLQKRIENAKISKGISSDTIRGLAINIIKSHQLKGSAIDFGAGKGDLLKDLLTANIFSEIHGIDIMERPENIPSSVIWHKFDLNEKISIQEKFDTVVSTEVIEHLENPRATFRNYYELLKYNGYLIVTMPNQESIRSYLSLILGGHFAAFRGKCYPAHITHLLSLDISRICFETGFSKPKFYYTDSGSIPKFPHIKWQDISLKLLRGRLFSDNIAFITQKKKISN